MAFGANELDFRFSIIQTLGYWAFNKGLPKLEQVTSYDHHTIQHYIIPSGVSQSLLIAVCTLFNVHYLAQAHMFTTDSLDHVTQGCS